MFYYNIYTSNITCLLEIPSIGKRDDSIVD